MIQYEIKNLATVPRDFLEVDGVEIITRKEREVAEQMLKDMARLMQRELERAFYGDVPEPQDCDPARRLTV